MLHVIFPARVLGRIVACPLLDPAANQRNLGGSQRRLVPAHQRFAVFRRDLLDQVALVRLARHDGLLAALHRP